MMKGATGPRSNFTKQINLPCQDKTASKMNEPNKHHHHHHKHTHSETLGDGTVIKKYKKKKTLPDGSLVVKSVTKTVPPAKVSAAEQSLANRVLKRTKTKTRQTHPDGISHTTTTVEETITSNPIYGNGSHEYGCEVRTSHLPDGTELRTKTEFKLLPDGNLSTVTTTVHVVMAEPSSNKADLENFESESNRVQNDDASPNESTEGLGMCREALDTCHDVSLETFDGHGDYAPKPMEYNQDNKDTSRTDELSFNKSLETIEGELNAPIPFEYCQGGKNSCTDKSPYAISSYDEPVPVQYLEEMKDMNATKKASSAPSTAGAHFISATKDDIEIKTKTKEGEMQQSRSIEVIRNYADQDDIRYIDIRDGRKVNINFNEMSHEQSYEDSEQLKWHGSGTNASQQDAKRKTTSPYTAFFHSSDTQKEKKRNFVLRLFKVAPADSKHMTPGKLSECTDEKIISQQSKASSKDRSSNGIDTTKSHTSKKDDSIDDNSSPTSPGYTDEELAVATRVDPSMDEPIYAAIEYDPDSKPPLFHNRRCRVYTALSLLLFTIVVSLVVVYSTKKGKEDTVQKQIIYVTLAPTPRPTTNREALGINNLIEEKVLQDNARFNSMDENDPRLLALDWILHKDEMQLESFDSNLSQRYVLALIAFQLDYQVWTSCGGNYWDTEVTCTVDINGTDPEEEYRRWLSGTNECDWYGVECLGGIVREIRLREYLQSQHFGFLLIFCTITLDLRFITTEAENNLVGQIPPEISVLRNLDVLAMNGNCLYGSLPSTLGMMTNLQQLYIQDNGLNGFVPDELSSMSSLTHLNLAWQSENSRSCISSSGDLVYLNTSSGELSYGLEGKVFEMIKSLRHLREVNIEDNYFSGQITPDIKNLKQLGE